VKGHRDFDRFRRALSERAFFILVPAVVMLEVGRRLLSGEEVQPALVAVALGSVYILYRADRKQRADRVLAMMAVMLGGAGLARSAGYESGAPDTAATLLALGGVGILMVVMVPRPSWIRSALYAGAVVVWIMLVSHYEQTPSNDLFSRVAVVLSVLLVAPWLVRRVRSALAEAGTSQEARLQLQRAVATAVNAVVLGGSAVLEDAAGYLRDGAGVSAVIVERYRGAMQSLIPTQNWTVGVPRSVDPGLDEAIDPGDAKLLAEGSCVERTGNINELVVPIHGPGGVLGSVRLLQNQHRAPSPELCDTVGSLAEIIGVTWRREAAEELAERRQARLEAESRREDALATVAKSLLVTKGDESLVTSIAALVRSTSADIGIIGRIAPGDAQFDALVVGFESGSGIVTERFSLRAIPDIVDTLAGGEPVEFADGAWHIPPALRSGGIKSAFLIPVRVRGSLVGAVAMASREAEHLWSSGDRSLFERAAVLIGAYWEGSDNESTLRELLRSKDRFIASVSHELRTPLTAVLGLAAELADGESLSDAEQQELASLVAEQASDVSHIVEDLLVAARAESEMLTIVPERFDLDAEVRQVIDRFELEVEFLGGANVGAYADPHRVRQILRNLMTNAVRYGGDQVQVETVNRGSTVEVRVSDDGDGVDSDQVDDIFDPYVRAHNAVGNPDSVGLGLAVARQLARMMGGDVTYARTDVTTFCLVLPRSAEVSDGSVGVEAAVNENLAPPHIAASLDGKENGQAFEVLGLAPTSERNP